MKLESKKVVRGIASVECFTCHRVRNQRLEEFPAGEDGEGLWLACTNCECVRRPQFEDLDKIFRFGLVTMDARVIQASEDAEHAFWAVVAKAFPEARSGDFTPEETHEFSQACLDAVRAWVRYNVREEE